MELIFFLKNFELFSSFFQKLFRFLNVQNLNLTLNSQIKIKPKMLLQSQSQNKSHVQLEAVVGFISELAMIIAFGLLTNKEKYYFPCSQSSSTYGWSVITFYSYIAVFVIHGLMVPILTCTLASGSMAATGMCLCFLFVARLAAGVMTLVCYGGLIYAYEYEDCGSLTTLALVYIILISIGLGLGVCGLLCACIMVCTGAGAVLAAEQQQSQMENFRIQMAALNAAANSSQTNQNAGTGGYNAFEGEKV